MLFPSLSNYRVLGQPTTYWCPEREEHGYLLTPVFKCSTNPRVTTAHRWTVVDVIGTMDEPTGLLFSTWSRFVDVTLVLVRVLL